jgi:GAF domain-containing protein
MGVSGDALLVLSALSRAIAATGDAGGLYDAIAQAAVTTLGARVSRVWVNDPGARILAAAGSFGVNPDTERDLLDAVSVPHGTGVPGQIAISRTAEFIADAHEDPRWLNRRYVQQLGLRGYAGLPLIAGEHVVGVLSILFDHRREFSDADRAVASMLADYSAITLRIVQLGEDRRRADSLDAVTRVARALSHELNNPLAVVLVQVALLSRELSDRPRATERLERIKEAAGRLAVAVRRMNTIVRLETSHHPSSTLPPMLDLERSSDDAR